MKEVSYNPPDALRQKLILDVKWRKLLKLAKWFRFAPFVQFVLASDSMALGTVNEDSDFDVIVSVREGRIFTARYFINFIFSVLRARRLNDVKGSSPDKFCFSHFITPVSFKKSGLDEYGREIYRHLVPICGDGKSIGDFFEANKELGIKSETKLQDLRFSDSGPNLIGKMFEFLLGGWLGDIIEKNIAEPVARRRLARYVEKKPKWDRVIISDKELEFHFDLK
ncbi:MAG: hypothetical protein AAB399_01385 [Patescibacteria group bacterium]